MRNSSSTEKETTDNFIDADLTGKHHIEIKMGSGSRTRRQITVMTENFNIPKNAYREVGEKAPTKCSIIQATHVIAW
ncbi:MAG: hypothetical protein L6U16_14260 [Porphyromonadaceae bacterium]|nr:MAG: hypothetical protein L6U16_14260 [Porphyromonadaceae bacterium]